MEARERTLRGWGGHERHAVDEIGYGELRREPHKRAREGGGLPDMAEEGLGSEGGGERAEPIGREVGGGSNDGKTSAEYVRALKKSASVGEADVMLVGFRMRNGFRGRLVMGLKERGYQGKKAGGRAYLGRSRKERCRRRTTSAKGQHGNECIGSEGMKRMGAGGRVSGGWLRQGGSNASGHKRAASTASGRLLAPPDALDAALSLPDRMSPGGHTQNRSLRYKCLECLSHRVSGESQNARYFFCRCIAILHILGLLKYLHPMFLPKQ